MSKGSLLLCSLVLVQVCIVQLCLISSWQLTAGQAGGKFLCHQDPIGRPPRLMSNHGREDLHGHSFDWIFDEELAEEGYASDGGGVLVEEEEGGCLMRTAAVEPRAAAPVAAAGMSNVPSVGTSDMTAAEAHADGYGGSIVKIPKKRRNMLKEIREAHRKKTKLVPPPPPKEKGPYICKYCYAEFSTHQALAGHMAGHHRDKKVQTLDDASSRAHQGMAAQSQDGKLQVKGGGDDDDSWRDSGLSLRRGLLSEQLSMASNVPRQSRQASGGQMIKMRQQHSGRRSDGLALAAPTPAPTSRLKQTTEVGEGC
ncbi:unnamed protein product [Miscanthus lutarioriparius]|uniref:C2H2-type domain-containing protein n=1 Tax=Miscanthus lutarioriparius TaxID=422564 RepID=A0A811QXI4_9POAL|nr:unnamed protein product [Miscanthus lutarioriparius]